MYVLCMAVVLLPVCPMNNTNRMGLSRQPCRHPCSQDIVLARPSFIVIRAPGKLCFKDLRPHVLKAEALYNQV